MKTKILIIVVFLFTLGTWAQGVVTPVDRLKIKVPPKNNVATRVLVQDTISKEVGWVLKSTLTPTKQFVNEITEQKGFTLTGQDLVINADWEWIINDNLYSNTASQTINIPLASTGMSRIDIVVCNTANGFVRVVGTESSTTPNAPPIPLNTIQATFFVVEDTVIEEPAPAVTSSLYIPKSDKVRSILTGSSALISAGKFAQRSSFEFVGAYTTVSKISWSNNRDGYYGRIFTFKNGQATNITITHDSNSGPGNPFIFSNGQDYVLTPNEIIEFSFNSNTNKLEHIGKIASIPSAAITDGVTTTSPSENAVFDALATKANTSLLNNYIPLTGTTVGNPVAGDIEVSDGFRLLIDDGSINIGGFIGNIMLPSDGGGTNNPTIAYPEASHGLGGLFDYSPNITNLDYTQKIYVDTGLATKQDSLVSGTNIKTINGNSLLGSGDVVISGSGTTETASNGLTKVADDIKLGGVLTGNTSIDLGSGATQNKLTLVSTSTGTPVGHNALEVNVSGAVTGTNNSAGYFVNTRTGSVTNYALQGISSGGSVNNGVKGDGTSVGVLGNSTGNFGMGVKGSVSGTNAVAIQASATSTSSGVVSNTVEGIPIIANMVSTNLTAVKRTLILNRLAASPGGSDGIGNSILFQTGTNGVVTSTDSNELISKWTNATYANRTSEFSITGLNNSTTNTLMTLGGAGKTTLNKYGVGAFTGTPTYALQVDASGNIIEGALAGGGGATNLSYAASPTNGTVTSDTGADAAIPLADGVNAGLITPAEKTKIASSITSYTETDPLSLKSANNLSDLTNVTTARTNLGLGTLALSNATIPTNTNELTNGSGYITSYTETDPVVKAITGLVKSNGTTISAAIAGTDYLTPTGSAGALTSFPTLNQNTTGNADTATNLTGLTTSVATLNNQSGTNTGDNSVNSNYASDYRAANFVAGTNYQAPITLTTTGTSGASTLIGNTLNIPSYSGGAGGLSGGVINYIPKYDSTTSIVPGSIYDNGNVGIGTTTPASKLDVNSEIIGASGIRLSNMPANNNMTIANNLTVSSYPEFIATDKFGNVFVTQSAPTNLITKITPTGTVTTGWATTGGNPRGIVFDSYGNIYTPNSNTNTVTKITPSGVTTTYATLTAGFKTPRGIVIDASNNLFTVNYNTNDITKITGLETFTTFGNISTNSNCIVMDSSGNLYTTSGATNTIIKTTQAGVSTTFATLGNNAGRLAIDSNDNIYCASGSVSGIIYKITSVGVVTTFATLDNFGSHIFIDNNNTLYVSSSNLAKFYKITADGTITSSALSTTLGYGITKNNSGIYVCLYNSGLVAKVTESTNISEVLAVNSTGDIVNNPNLTTTVGNTIANITSDTTGKAIITKEYFAANAGGTDTNAVHKTGNETITGIKTFSVADSSTNLTLTNSGNSTEAMSITNTGSGNFEKGLSITNNSAGGFGLVSINNSGNAAGRFINNGTVNAIIAENNGTGSGIEIMNLGSGSGSALLINNGTSLISSSAGIIINSEAASTAKLFIGKSSSVETSSISKNGDIAGNSFIKTGGTGAQYLMADGTTSAGSTSTDSRLITDVLTADQSNSTVTLTKVTGLDQTLETGIYQFKYMVRYQSSATTTGVRFSVNHTGTLGFFTATERWTDVSATASTATTTQNGVISAGQVTGNMSARAKSTTGWGTTLGVDTINADMMIIIEGTFEVTASGNIELWHGSETANATTVKAGSNLVITKVN